MARSSADRMSVTVARTAGVVVVGPRGAAVLSRETARQRGRS